MKKLLILFLLINSFPGFGQADTSRILRAFPITDYIIPLTDSTKLVQVEMPDIVKLTIKQPGMLYGVYSGTREETVQKGYGKCYLVKGNYYYFAVGQNTSGLELKKGDLLYTWMEPTGIYNGFLPKLAAHFIRLQNVYEEPFYDRYLIFQSWNRDQEEKMIDSMIRDIQFTGNYFTENSPAVDKPITTGRFAGKKTLSMMINCKKEDLVDFFNYILARPRLYAGHEWKIAEIFATWLSEGAPTVSKH